MSKITYTSILIIMLFLIVYAEEDDHDHASHSGTKISEAVTTEKRHDEHADQDEHVDHDDGAKNNIHADHDDEEEEEGIELTPTQQKEIGLTLARASGGSIGKELTFAGEIRLNEDHLAHVTVGAAGVVQEVHATLGQGVHQGDVLAVIRSSELGEAKSAYVEAANELNCCTVDLVRAQEIYSNVIKLQKRLEQKPELGEVVIADLGDMGSYRSLLIVYSELVVAEKNASRKQALYTQKIVSENDLLNAQNAQEKARAEYRVAMDNARFETLQNLQENERTQRVNQIRLLAAERSLEVMGLPLNVIRALGTSDEKPDHECTDPDCKDCSEHTPSNSKHAAIVEPVHECTDTDCKDCPEPNSGASKHDDHEHEPDLGFAEMYIHAPITGTIIEKHINRGERVSESSDIFTIADLSTVWVDLKISAKDVGQVQKGVAVQISSPEGLQTEGRIELISPVMDVQTRTVLCRVIIKNDAKQWKPGTFVTGSISTESGGLSVVVEASAVQNLADRDVVFVPGEHGFRAVPVVVARRGQNQVQLVSGLKPGDEYVARGAYELKAVKVTSGAGAHAGHGH